MLSGKSEGARGREVENAEAKKKARLFRWSTPLGIRTEGAFLCYQDIRSVHSFKP